MPRQRQLHGALSQRVSKLFTEIVQAQTYKIKLVIQLIGNTRSNIAPVLLSLCCAFLQTSINNSNSFLIPSLHIKKRVHILLK